jgi:hypothetical protein
MAKEKTKGSSKSKTGIKSLFETEVEVLAAKTGNVIRAANLLQQFVYVDPTGSPLFDTRGQLDSNATRLNQTRFANFRRAQKELYLPAVFGLYENESNHAALDRRVAAADQLFGNFHVPFETIDETEASLTSAIKNLEENRESLINTGFPEIPLWETSPYWQSFTRFYPTDLPSKRSIKKTKDGLRYIYEWKKSTISKLPARNLTPDSKKAFIKFRRSALDGTVNVLNKMVNCLKIKDTERLSEEALNGLVAITHSKLMGHLDSILRPQTFEDLTELEGYDYYDRPENYLNCSKIASLALHLETEAKSGAVAKTKQYIAKLGQVSKGASENLSYLKMAKPSDKGLVDDLVDFYTQSLPNAKSIKSKFKIPEGGSGLFDRIRQNSNDTKFRTRILEALGFKDSEALAKVTASDVAELTAPNVYIRKPRGNTWLIRFQNEEIYVDGQKGVKYIHDVIAAKSRPLSAAILEGNSVPREHRGRSIENEEIYSDHFAIHDNTSGIFDPLLDSKAKRAYVERIKELEKIKNRDAEQEREIKFIRKYLSPHGFKTSADKQKSAVRKAIEDAKKKIRFHSQEIERHFDVSVRYIGGWHYGPSPDQEWLT